MCIIIIIIIIIISTIIIIIIIVSSSISMYNDSWGHPSAQRSRNAL